MPRYQENSSQIFAEVSADEIVSCTPTMTEYLDTHLRQRVLYENRVPGFQEQFLLRHFHKTTL